MRDAGFVVLVALVSGCMLFARVPTSAHAPAYDLLITNGNPWFRADVAIKDGRVARPRLEN